MKTAEELLDEGINEYKWANLEKLTDQQKSGIKLIINDVRLDMLSYVKDIIKPS